MKGQRFLRRDELLLGLDDGGVGAGDARFGRGRRLDCLIELAAADRVAGRQALVAVAFALRLRSDGERRLLIDPQSLDGGPRRGDSRLGDFYLLLPFLFIEPHQRLAGLHLVALIRQDSHNPPRDFRTDRRLDAGLQGAGAHDLGHDVAAFHAIGADRHRSEPHPVDTRADGRDDQRRLGDLPAIPPQHPPAPVLRGRSGWQRGIRRTRRRDNQRFIRLPHRLVPEGCFGQGVTRGRARECENPVRRGIDSRDDTTSKGNRATGISIASCASWSR